MKIQEIITETMQNMKEEDKLRTMTAVDLINMSMGQTTILADNAYTLGFAMGLHAAQKGGC